jgi:hypothetical protein
MCGFKPVSVCFGEHAGTRAFVGAEEGVKGGFVVEVGKG